MCLNFFFKELERGASAILSLIMNDACQSARDTFMNWQAIHSLGKSKVSTSILLFVDFYVNIDRSQRRVLLVP